MTDCTFKVLKAIKCQKNPLHIEMMCRRKQLGSSSDHEQATGF